MAQTFPKSARLLKPSEFRFQKFSRYHSSDFSFVYTPDQLKHGEARLGISISKKVLRRANSRNRVRRLLREVFRANREQLGERDIHVIGRPALQTRWSEMKRADVQGIFDRFLEHIEANGA